MVAGCADPPGLEDNAVNPQFPTQENELRGLVKDQWPGDAVLFSLAFSMQNFDHKA